LDINIISKSTDKAIQAYSYQPAAGGFPSAGGLPSAGGVHLQEGCHLQGGFHLQEGCHLQGHARNYHTGVSAHRGVKTKMGIIRKNNSHFTEGYRSNLQCQATVIMTGCILAETITTALSPGLTPVTVLTSDCPFDYPKVILGAQSHF
jgi:hypothetical protein